MTQETKIILGISIATIAIIVGAIFMLGVPSSNSSAQQPAQRVTDPKLLIGSTPHLTGPAKAKVTIVEFGDYQCPACGAAYPITQQIMQQYKNKVDFVFRNFPLDMHPNARPAAMAAEAAGKQGKYWQMHDKLYEFQSDWSDLSNPTDTFVKYAQEIGLNVDQFKADLNNKDLKNKIDADAQDGYRLGVNSTPTFFINGEKNPGVLGFDTFKAKIDSALKGQ